jgi:hypothetical protein
MTHLKDVSYFGTKLWLFISNRKLYISHETVAPSTGPKVMKEHQKIELEPK